MKIYLYNLSNTLSQLFLEESTFLKFPDGFINDFFIKSYRQ